MKNALIYVDNIVKSLSTLVPEEKSFFKAQGESYKKKIRALFNEIKDEMSTVSLENRKVLTNHDAFQYLGHDFHIYFFSPLGMSTEAEASAKTVVTLIEKIRDRGIHAIFVEKTLNPRLIQQIAKETGTHVAGSLYSDALDVPGTDAGTYLGMMKFNLYALVKALQTPRESKD